MGLTAQNVSVCCRTCLKELGSEASFDIYNTPNLVKWLVVCTSLDFEKNDGYPSRICQSCHTKMKISYEFRIMCNQSLRKLDELLNTYATCKLDKLDISTPNGDLNSPEWLNLAGTLDWDKASDQKPKIMPLPFNAKVKEHDNNVASNIALDEQEIDQNDIFSGLMDDNSDSDSTPEQNILDEIEIVSAQTKASKTTVQRRGRKPKDEDYTMPAYIKTPEIYNCEKCKKKFFKKDRFDAHVRLHDGLKPYPCKLCDKSYNKSSHLKVHVMDVHTEHKDEFKCEYEGCDKVFRRKQTLRVHCRIKHSEVKYEPKIFICEECGKTFRNIGALKDHRFKHTGEEYPYKCEQCGKGYISQRTYRDHLMRHAGIKNFVCPYCGLRKTTKSELRIHINYHTKEKQWPCPSCPQVFNSSANLGLHNRIVHKGIRRFKCRFCEQSFGKAETLKHHEMRHTGEKPHECTFCGKRFIQVVALRAHLKTHNKS